MSELSVGTLSGLAANSYEVGIASGSTLDLANAKAGSIPDNALSAVPGLKHIHSGTYTSVASVAIDDVFSATYDNYRLIISKIQSDSTSTELNVRLRTGGSTLSNSSYYWATYGYRHTATVFSDAGAAQSSSRLGRLKETALNNNYSYDVWSPFRDDSPTFFWGGGFGTDSTLFTIHSGAAYTPNTQVDGLYLFPSSGNFATITVDIYGYSEVA